MQAVLNSTQSWTPPWMFFREFSGTFEQVVISNTIEKSHPKALMSVRKDIGI